MDTKTQVKSMKVRSRVQERHVQEESLVQPMELPPKESWGILTVSADRLMRNFAVVGVLLLVVVAVRNSSSPEAASVFSALQEGAGMEWDESVGKLSFVNSWLPEGIQAVWSAQDAIEVMAPVQGETIHAWSEQEPYLTIQSSVKDVRAAADGEVMSIAHGLGEERIIRVRHDDGTEALYGNLAACYAQVGDWVHAGDIIAQLDGQLPLAFEWRVEGRSVDPSGKWTNE